MVRLTMTLLALLLASESSFAVLSKGPRRPHQHADWFNEQAIFLGLKAGPQITTYTPMSGSGQEFKVQSSAGVVLGPAIEFVYPSHRIEIDAFWTARNGINTTDSLNSAAGVGLLKFPARISRDTDLEVGVGVEADFVVGGSQPRNNVLFGVLASLGFVSRLGDDTMLSFEGRYNLGLKRITNTITGGQPRDLQLLVGWLWVF